MAVNAGYNHALALLVFFAPQLGETSLFLYFDKYHSLPLGSRVAGNSLGGYMLPAFSISISDV